MSEHGIDLCACGAVVAQCRCMDCGAERRVVATACSECKDAKKLPERGDERHATPTRPKIVICG